MSSTLNDFMDVKTLSQILSDYVDKPGDKAQGRYLDYQLPKIKKLSDTDRMLVGEVLAKATSNKTRQNPRFWYGVSLLVQALGVHNNRLVDSIEPILHVKQDPSSLPHIFSTLRHAGGYLHPDIFETILDKQKLNIVGILDLILVTFSPINSDWNAPFHSVMSGNYGRLESHLFISRYQELADNYGEANFIDAVADSCGKLHETVELKQIANYVSDITGTTIPFRRPLVSGDRFLHIRNRSRIMPGRSIENSVRQLARTG